MSGSLASIEDRQGQAFRRWVVASALGHAALVVLLGLSPRPGTRATPLPAVVKVNLLAPAGRPAPRPVPRPVAKPTPPPPKPPPPAPKKVVLPTEPTRQAEPEPPRPEAKPRPRPAPKQPEPPPKPQESYEDVLASLRDEVGEQPAQPVEVADARALPEAAGGVGVPISAEEAAWRKRAKLHVHRKWVLDQGFRLQPLETEVRVRLGPGGHVLELRRTRPSGNPWYDESVERAIRTASPLPAPPEAGEWIFLFRPEDLF